MTPIGDPVPVPSTPTNPADLREQIARALSKAATSRGYRLRDERAPLTNAALSVVAPVLEGLRAEIKRHRAQAGAWSLHVDQARQVLAEASSSTVDETRETPLHRLVQRLVAERDSERESRIAWACEADRLEQVAERATHLAGRVLSEFIQKGYPGGPSVRTGWVGADTVTAWHRELAELSRPSASDQTPATPANSGEWCNCQSATTWHPAGDTADCAPSSVQGDTTPGEVDLLRQAAKAAREHGNELRADVFEVAAKDHEDDDCPKGERAECMAVELARKALAEYATSAPPEGDTTPEEDQPKPRVWHKGDAIPVDVMTVKDGDGDTLTRELDPKYKGERMWRWRSKHGGNGFAWREDYLLDRWGALSEVLATSARPRETTMPEPTTDAASDPVGTVRDLGNRTSFPEDNPLAHINRYWIKWTPPHDLDEDRPWVAINHEADLQRMPNDLMDAYPVVPLLILSVRLGHAAPSSVQGDTTPDVNPDCGNDEADCVHGLTSATPAPSEGDPHA